MHGTRFSIAILTMAAFTGCDGGTVGGDAGCQTELAVVCDGDDVTARDNCSGASTVVETCSGACYRGACVDCAPEAGRLCMGSNVHDVDSCGNVGAVVETCTGECRAGSCVGAECTPEASMACVEDTLYTRDSCDNLENAIAVCQNGCESGACTGCTPNMYTICYDGDIYSVDSCRVLGAIVEDCAETCRFDAGAISCVTGATCTIGTEQTCFRGDLHYVDDCGSVQPDVSQDCESGCNDSGCLPCAPAPIGTTCSDGNVHELLGGCGGTPTAGAMVEACAQGCRDGACLTGDCIPEVGTVCSAGNVHLVDSCGTVGAMVETCTAGCEMGACTGAPPQDAGSSDAGMPSGCTCTRAGDTYPPVNCTIGATRCGGCIGYDDFCDDSAACLSQCRSEFTCVDGAVLLDGAVVESCSSGSGPLCAYVCGA